MGSRRQAEDRIDLLAVAGVPRRQRGAEAERRHARHMFCTAP